MNITTRIPLPISLGFPPEKPATPSVAALFDAYETRVFRRTNRFFQILLVIQWIVSLLFAVIVSPRAWEGSMSYVHPHVLAAVFLGGAFCLFPLFLIRQYPLLGTTRHVVAIAQLGFSSLLIHLTGGRIETHFHVFGSLAFLALYRDWKIIPTATLVVAADHLFRGIWYPESVYGVAYATPWRTLEHSAWVIFEDIVLIWSCFVSRHEMLEICEQQNKNECLLDELDTRVKERTQDLETEIAEHRRTGEQLRRSEERFRDLVNNAPIGIFQTTPEGRELLVNPRLADMLGYASAEDYLQRDKSEEDAAFAGFQEPFRELLLKEGEVRGFESVYTRRDGTKMHVLANARAIHDADGNIRSIEGTVEDVTERKRAENELTEVHSQLVEASRQAGMAEVATGVLHNVGNVLNSVNISATEVRDRLAHSRLSHLRKIDELIRKNGENLGEFLTRDPKGKALPGFINKLSQYQEEESAYLQNEMESVTRHVEHIKQIVTMQQSYARVFGVLETFEPRTLIEDAIQFNRDSIERHHITVERELTSERKIIADRHKALQILVNLLRNAKQAIQEANATDRRITVRLFDKDEQTLCVAIQDTGMGISAKNLSKIFLHGFTTKKNGHGFGLHSSVLAAREMNGDLTVASDGPGRGATFTLELPVSFDHE